MALLMPRTAARLLKLAARLPATLAVTALLAGGITSAGGELSLTESQVKSLFLLNFTKYVEWPPQAFVQDDSPITIGLYGENKIGDDLEKAVSGKSVNGRAIAIRRIDKPEDLRTCQILFISDSEKKRQAEILEAVRKLPILTVGESDQFIDQGGVINFAMKEGKVRLEVSLQAARLANLQVSSKLLSVADAVKGKSR